MFEAFKFTKSGTKRHSTSTPVTRASPPADGNETEVRLQEKLGTGDPLRLIIIGHNPSEQAWAKCHYYANPNNWMWRILKETGLTPPQVKGPEGDELKAELVGIGFTDVGYGVPGTDSSQFGSKHFDIWRESFFDRLSTHVSTVNEKIGCTCGLCGVPAFIAFSGKRQFIELFPSNTARKKTNKKAKTTSNLIIEKGEMNPVEPTLHLSSVRPIVNHGRQTVLPSGWPLPLNAPTEVWVMPSTSGAAPMTREQRFGPWQELAKRVLAVPWPRYKPARLKCQQVKS